MAKRKENGNCKHWDADKKCPFGDYCRYFHPGEKKAAPKGKPKKKVSAVAKANVDDVDDDEDEEEEASSEDVLIAEGESYEETSSDPSSPYEDPE